MLEKEIKRRLSLIFLVSFCHVILPTRQNISNKNQQKIFDVKFSIKRRKRANSMQSKQSSPQENMSHSEKNIALDLTLTSTVTHTNLRSELLYETGEAPLCKRHERLRKLEIQKKEKRNSHSQPRKMLSRNLNTVQNVFRKNPLQKKLDDFGIKMKVDFSTRRKVFPLDHERLVRQCYLI